MAYFNVTGMRMDKIEQFERMLASGQDNALLRFSLGGLMLKHGRFQEAAVHLRAALDQDPRYSAAWKLLGRALLDSGDEKAALEAWQAGIEVAKERGDMQASREMEVFVRRLQRRGEDRH